MKKKKTKTIFKVYRLINGVKKGRSIASFNSRKDAVYYCKVNQTLPLPNHEWEDEFYIEEQKNVPN